ncbi:MAG: hypothetical protein M3480_09500, partial [Verrucomicrobiota bacterium]|nr:hypothetical protein [Verrucomicrobiota bacterium]
MKLNQLRFFLCGALLGLLPACGGGGASYYRLDATAPSTGGGGSGLSVSVGPVSLPGYIDRSEIV